MYITLDMSDTRWNVSMKQVDQVDKVRFGDENNG